MADLSAELYRVTIPFSRQVPANQKFTESPFTSCGAGKLARPQLFSRLAEKAKLDSLGGLKGAKSLLASFQGAFCRCCRDRTGVPCRRAGAVAILMTKVG